MDSCFSSFENRRNHDFKGDFETSENESLEFARIPEDRSKPEIQGCANISDSAKMDSRHFGSGLFKSSWKIHTLLFHTELERQVMTLLLKVAPWSWAGISRNNSRIILECLCSSSIWFSYSGRIRPFWGLDVLASARNPRLLDCLAETGDRQSVSAAKTASINRRAGSRMSVYSWFEEFHSKSTQVHLISRRLHAYVSHEVGQHTHLISEKWDGLESFLNWNWTPHLDCALIFFQPFQDMIPISGIMSVVRKMESSECDFVLHGFSSTWSIELRSSGIIFEMPTFAVLFSTPFFISSIRRFWRVKCLNSSF